MKILPWQQDVSPPPGVVALDLSHTDLIRELDIGWELPEFCWLELSAEESEELLAEVELLDMNGVDSRLHRAAEELALMLGG